jgi:hypothetical protein
MSPAGAGNPTASVSGKVVDENGSPVQGTRIELLRSWAPTQNRGPNSMVVTVVSDPSQPDIVRYRALSGPDGMFRVSGLPADSWFSLGIALRGFTVLVQRGIVIPPRGGKVALGTFQLPKSPTVAGRVTDSKGHPLARARIWALSARDLEFRGLPTRSPDGGPAAVTGPDGRFEIPRFEPGILEVCRKGFSPLQIAVQSASLNRIVLMPLPLPSRISGRVLDDQGMPIATAEVHIALDDPVNVLEPIWHPCSPQPPGKETVLAYDGKLPPEQRIALTDREGRFTFDLTGSGTVEIWAKAAGYLEKQDADPWATFGVGGLKVSYSPQSPGKVEFVLTQGAVLSGRVLTANGLPAGSAEVSLSWNPTLSASTDGEGHYRLIGVRPGHGEVRVRHSSGEAVCQLEVAPGEKRLPDLVLDNDGIREIRGRVTDSDGAGIPEAFISLRGGSEAAPTGPDGSFQLDFRSSRAEGRTLEMDVETLDSMRQHLRLDPAAATAAPLEIRIDRGTRLTGYILGVDPENLPDVSVEALQDHDFHSSLVSRDGRFQIVGLSPGELVVTASFDGRCESANVTVETGVEEAVLNLEIPSRVEVRGTVLAPEGTPIAGARVSFLSAQTSPGCVRTSSTQVRSKDDGSFSASIQEGQYTVRVDADGYYAAVGAPFIVARSPVEGLEVRPGRRFREDS